MSAEPQTEVLGPSAWSRYREIRLRGLLEAPLAFGAQHEEEAGRPEADWRRLLDETTALVAVLPDHGDVGVVRLAADRKHPEVGWLVSMWVAPEARGRGVGDALVQEVKSRAWAAGYRRLRLDVADLNQDAVLLYARHGFERTGAVGAFRSPRDHIREHRRECDLTE